MFINLKNVTFNFDSGDSRLGNEPAASPDQTNECLILSTLQCQLWGRAI